MSKSPPFSRRFQIRSLARRPESQLWLDYKQRLQIADERHLACYLELMVNNQRGQNKGVNYRAATVQRIISIVDGWGDAQFYFSNVTKAFYYEDAYEAQGQLTRWKGELMQMPWREHHGHNSRRFSAYAPPLTSAVDCMVWAQGLNISPQLLFDQLKIDAKTEQR